MTLEQISELPGTVSVECLDRLEAIWLSGEIPDISQFLRQPAVSRAETRRSLVEWDLEYRCYAHVYAAGLRPQVLIPLTLRQPMSMRTAIVPKAIAGVGTVTGRVNAFAWMVDVVADGESSTECNSSFSISSSSITDQSPPVSGTRPSERNRIVFTDTDPEWPAKHLSYCLSTA